LISGGRGSSSGGRTRSYWQPSKLAYTVEEAGELLSLSRAQVYRLIDSCELESVKIGKCRRITADQLARFTIRVEHANGGATVL
jgi:excisionase family DNA binding protein